MTDDQVERQLQAAELVERGLVRLRELRQQGAAWDLEAALLDLAAEHFVATAKRHLQRAVALGRSPFTDEAQARAFLEGVAAENVAALNRLRTLFVAELRDDEKRDRADGEGT